MDGLELIEKLKFHAALNDESIMFFLSNYILNNLENIQTMDINEFAKNSNTSKPSVVRFCQKLGLEGFAELKFCIKNYIKNNYLKFLNQDCAECKSENAEWYEIYKKIQDESQELLHHTYNHAKLQISELINKIRNARRIYVFGMNLAYNSAQNFVQRMQLMNFDTIAEQDILIIESYLVNITPDDLIIVVSLSGFNKYLETVMVNKKCYTFGILGNKGTLEQICDDTFIIPHPATDRMGLYSIKSQALLEFFDYLCRDLLCPDN